MDKLNEKQKKVLELLRQNKYTIKEIAKEVGFHPKHISRLKATCPEFQTNKDLDKITDEVIKESKSLCHKKLFTWIKSLNPNDIKTKIHHKQLIDAINALSKAPIVNIKIAMQLTDKEWEDEFNRITALARATALSRRVQGIEQRREDSIPPTDSTKDSGGEGLQDPEIPTESEAEEISPE